MQIRRANVDDSDDIARIVCAGWRWAYSGILPAAFLDEFCNPTHRAEGFRSRWNEDNLRYVAIDSQTKMLGYVLENPTPVLPNYDAEIAALYVDPAHVRSGIGQSLVREIVAEFLLRGNRSLAIQTLAANHIACRFYEKIGGIKVAESTWRNFPSLWYGWADMQSIKLTETSL